MLWHQLKSPSSVIFKITPSLLPKFPIPVIAVPSYFKQLPVVSVFSSCTKLYPTTAYPPFLVSSAIANSSSLFLPPNSFCHTTFPFASYLTIIPS